MIFTRFSWLEIAEYISILLSIISLIIYFYLDQIAWFLGFLLISLILNVINRFRLEIRTRSRLAAALNIQLRKFSEEVEEIKQKIDNSEEDSSLLKPPQRLANNIQQSDSVIIGSLQQDLDSLDKSITSIIQYINKHKFDQRMDILELSFKNIKEEILSVNNTFNRSKKVILPDENLLPNQPINYPIDPPPIISWKCLHIITAHNESVTGLAISDDYKCLASVSWDQCLKLWSLEDGNLIDSVIASEQGLLVVTMNKFSLNDSNSCKYCLATGSFDQNIKIWSLLRDKQDELMISLEHTITGHTGSIHGLTIASEQNILVSGSYDQTVKQWDLTTGKMLQSSYDQNGSIYAIAVHEQGQFIISGGGDGNITIWELKTGKKLSVLTGNLASIESIAINSWGTIIAAGCVDGTIKLWEIKPNTFITNQKIEPSLVIQAHNGQVMSLVFSPNGQLLYSSAVDGQIKIWYPSTGKPLGHLKISDENRVFSLALSNDGTLLAAGGIDGTIKIWQQS